MNEALPVVLGVVIGVVFGRARSRWALAAAAVLVAGGGLLASVATGEIHESWGYVLFDVALVSAAAIASARVVRRFAPRSRRAVT